MHRLLLACATILATTSISVAQTVTEEMKNIDTDKIMSEQITKERGKRNISRSNLSADSVVGSV